MGALTIQAVLMLSVVLLGQCTDKTFTKDRPKPICHNNVEEETTVKIHGECAFSSSCKRSNELAECIEIRPGQCVCELQGLAEERQRKTKKGKREKKNRKRENKNRRTVKNSWTKSINDKRLSKNSKKENRRKISHKVSGVLCDTKKCSRGDKCVDSNNCGLWEFNCIPKHECVSEEEIPEGYKKMKHLPGYLKFITNVKDWESARADCQKDDPSGRTDLVVINSKVKNDEVNKVMTGAGSRLAWIGLKQNQGEQWKYTWVDGRQMTAVKGKKYNKGKDGKGFQNWRDYPSMDGHGKDGRDCVLMERYLFPGTWGDSECSKKFDYVCEFTP